MIHKNLLRDIGTEFLPLIGDDLSFHNYQIE